MPLLEVRNLRVRVEMHPGTVQAVNGVDITLEAGETRCVTFTITPDALSFYFEDSEGNLLEIANADLWPR